MLLIRPTINALLCTIFVLLISISTQSHARGKATKIMEKNDSDGDEIITLDEWSKGKRKFKQLDSDGDGEITMDELKDKFGGGDDNDDDVKQDEIASQSRGLLHIESYVLDRVQIDFENMDANDDEKINRSEWSRRGNFSQMDKDGNNHLSFEEIFAMYKPSPKKGMVLYRSPPGEVTEELEHTIAESKIDINKISKQTLLSLSPQHDINIRIKDGLFKTGLGPLFPEGADCFAIDDGYGLDYTFKRGGRFYHGALDIPAPFGVPILAIADGTVVIRSKGRQSIQGTQITIRHSPKDTGLPVWIFALYSHFETLPNFKPGRRVRMGEILGPTGGSGKVKRDEERRPAVHMLLFYSDSPQFATIRRKVIPKDGHWMDPIALYKGTMPIDSYSMRDLPEEEKYVPIPVMYPDGTTEPANTKVIWPYACTKG